MTKKADSQPFLSVTKMEGQIAVDYLQRSDKQKRTDMLGKVDLILKSAAEHTTDDPKNPLFVGQREYSDCIKAKVKTSLEDLKNQLYSTHDHRYHEVKSSDITVDTGQLPNINSATGEQIEVANQNMQTRENFYAGHVVRVIGIIDAAMDNGDIETALLAFNARPDLVEHQPTISRFVQYFEKNRTDVKFVSDTLQALCKDKVDGKNLLQQFSAPTFSEDTRSTEVKEIGKLEQIGSGIVKYRETKAKNLKERYDKSLVLSLLKDEIRDDLQATARLKGEQFDGVGFRKVWEAEQDRQPKPMFEGEIIVRFMETDFCKGQKDYIIGELKEKLLVITLEDINEFTKHPPEYGGAQELIMENMAKQIVLLTDNFDANLLTMATEALKKERPLLGQGLEAKVKNENQKIALRKADEETSIANRLEEARKATEAAQREQEQKLLQEKQEVIEKGREFAQELKGGRVGGILRDYLEGKGFTISATDRRDVVDFLRGALGEARNSLPEPEGKKIGFVMLNASKYSREQVEQANNDISNYLNERENRKKLGEDDPEVAKEWMKLRLRAAYAKNNS